MKQWLYHPEKGGQIFETDNMPDDPLWQDHPNKCAKEVPKGSSEVDIDALRLEAESLGIKVDGRWGATKLAEAISGFSPDAD